MTTKRQGLLLYIALGISVLVLIVLLCLKNVAGDGNQAARPILNRQDVDCGATSNNAERVNTGRQPPPRGRTSQTTRATGPGRWTLNPLTLPKAIQDMRSCGGAIDNDGRLSQAALRLFNISGEEESAVNLCISKCFDSASKGSKARVIPVSGSPGVFRIPADVSTSHMLSDALYDGFTKTLGEQRAWGLLNSLDLTVNNSALGFFDAEIVFKNDSVTPWGSHAPGSSAHYKLTHPATGEVAKSGGLLPESVEAIFGGWHTFEPHWKQ